MRLFIAASAWLLVAIVLLCGFAGIRPSTPWSAQRDVTIPLERFDAVGASLKIKDAALAIIDAGAPQVFAAAPVEPFAAAGYRHVDVALSMDSTLLVALFAWNVDGAWHTLPLPGFGGGTVTVDLAAHPAWQGQVQAVGIALVPIDLVALQHAPPRSATLHRLRLRSDSAGGALSELATKWTAYRPWNGRSNHSSGFELGTRPEPSLAAFAAALLAASVLILMLALRPRPAGVAVRNAVVAALVGLAGWQVAQLAMRATVARQARAAVGDATDWPLTAMPELAQDALELERVLAQAPPARIVVWGANNFFREYPAWLLRRLDVGSMRLPDQLSLLQAAPLPATLVLVGGQGWTYDEASGELRLQDGPPVRAERVHRGRVLQAFRLIPAGAP